MKHAIRRNCGEIFFDNPSDSLEIKNIYSISRVFFTNSIHSKSSKKERKKEYIIHPFLFSSKIGRNEKPIVSLCGINRSKGMERMATRKLIDTSFNCKGEKNTRTVSPLPERKERSDREPFVSANSHVRRQGDTERS